MSKELEALEIVKKLPHINGFTVGDYTDKWEIIEKALEDFEWLKEHIGFQLLDHLSTSDKIKLLEIMGVEYNQGDWHIKL